jgi:predicted RNA-binding Zn ribbon-like protein
MSKRADCFDWSGGHPALDLVNTLDERPFPSPIEYLATYADLVGFAELAGLIDPAAAARLMMLDRPACSRVAKCARELREQLHDVLSAVHRAKPAPRKPLNSIAAAIRAAHGARELVMSDSPGLASQRWSDARAPEVPLHACALAVEDLLVNVDRTRIRKCGAADCVVYFVDTSKAHRRQWCSMKNCGNREKQKRWRSEHV